MLPIARGMSNPSDVIRQNARNRPRLPARVSPGTNEMALSPSYMGNRITIVLARKLFEKKLPGDEPEPPQVCWHGFEELLALQARRELQEAYAVAALFLARERLRGNAAA